MLISELLPLYLIFILFLLLSFSCFLNYLSALYSDVNLFKIDLIKKKKDRAKIKKLIFIFKNGNLLFTIICFYQVFLNIIISHLFITSISDPLVKEMNWSSNYSWAFVIGLSFFIALFTEIFVRYLANRPGSRKMIFNKFFIDFTYSIIRPFYYLLRPIVKPKKKIFTNSEQDIIRFINNLTADDILEKREAKLIQSAFNFDELSVSTIITPWKKTIILNQSMTYSEIQAIHAQHFFTRYPVLDNQKKLMGIFNVEVFYWRLIKNENRNWVDYIDKKIIYLSPQDKLDYALTRLKNANCRLAVIREKKKLLGIITLQDILSALVGKIRDERDILLLPSRQQQSPRP